MSQTNFGEKIQQALESVPDRMWDVIVIGAGPAGTIAALHTAKNGLSVLMIDRDWYPREKTCGDGLTTDAFRYLKNAGLYKRVEAVGHRIEKAVAFGASLQEIRFDGPFITLKRSILDHILAKGAIEAGAVFSQGKVADIAVQPDKSVIIKVDNCKRELRARIGLIATGVELELPGKLGCASSQPTSAVAVRCYVRSPLQIDELIGSYYPPDLPGYGWIFPMGDGLYNTGWISFCRGNGKPVPSLRKSYDRFVRKFPLTQELYKHGKVEGELRAAQLRCGLNGIRAVVGDSILNIGEVISSTLPLTGEGISRAMETGELAAKAAVNAIESNDLAKLNEYAEWIKTRVKPKYRGFAIAQKWNSIKWLNDFMAWRIRKSTYFQKAITAYINDKNDINSVFSAWGLLKSLWK